MVFKALESHLERRKKSAGMLITISTYFFFILISCVKTHNQVTGSDVTRIQFRYSDDRNDIFDQIKTVDVLHLETNKESSISRVDKFLINNGQLFLLDDGNNEIRAFDIKTGGYIGRVGIKGKGPGEYMETRDISIDSSLNELYILDYRRIHVINLNNLEFKKTLDVNFEDQRFYNPMSFCSIGQHRFLFWITSPDAWVIDGLEAFNLIYYDGSYSYFYPFPGTRDVLSIRFTNVRTDRCLIRPPLGDFRIMEWRGQVPHFKYLIDVPNPVPLDKVSIEDPRRISQRDIGDYESRITKVFECGPLVYLEIEGKDNYKYQGVVRVGAEYTNFSLRHLDFPHIVYSDGLHLYGYMLPDRILHRHINRDETDDYNEFFYSGIDMNDLDELDNPLIFKITLRD